MVLLPILLRTNIVHEGLFNNAALKANLKDNYDQYMKSWEEVQGTKPLSEWVQSPRSETHAGVILAWGAAPSAALFDLAGKLLFNKFQIAGHPRLTHGIHVFASFKFNQNVGVSSLSGAMLKKDSIALCKGRKVKVIALGPHRATIRREREDWHTTLKQADRKREDWNKKKFTAEHRWEPEVEVPMEDLASPDYNTQCARLDYTPCDKCTVMSQAGVAHLRTSLHPGEVGANTLSTVHTLHDFLGLLREADVQVKEKATLDTLVVDSPIDLLLLSLQKCEEYRTENCVQLLYRDHAKTQFLSVQQMRTLGWSQGASLPLKGAEEKVRGRVKNKTKREARTPGSERKDEKRIRDLV